MSSATRHDDAYRLLPWYANETLTGSDLKLVESHLRECIICRRELTRERALRELVQAGPTRSLAAREGFERLKRRLPRSGIAARGRSRSQATRGQWWALGIPVYVASVAAVLLVVAGVLTWQIQSVGEDAAFRTLTSPSAGAVASIDIVFADGIAEAELRSVVTAIGGSIVAGPTAMGRYRVELDTDADDLALAELVRGLVADPRVKFAGPTFAGRADE